ncbi:LysR family transcriptional regulator [Tistrella mobilis]
MNWDDLRYFLALQRSGSLLGAARVLKVDHTTVARRVDALETALGLRLFDRLPRGWVPTADGERLLPAAERVEEGVIALGRAGAAAGGLAGTVRVAVPPVFGAHFLAPRLAPLALAHPELELELAGDIGAVSLLRRDADLAVRLDRTGDGELIGRHLGRMGFALYGTPEHAARPPAHWEFAGYDDRLAGVAQQRWLIRQAAGRPVRLRANDLAALAEYAATGLALAALPHFLADPDPRLVRVVEDADDEAGRDIWLLVHADLRRSPRVRAVMDAVIGACARDRALLDGSGVAKPTGAPAAP